MNVNFKDKYLWQGLLLFVGCLTGVLFPSFMAYLFFIGMGVGIFGVVFSLYKQDVI